MPDKAIAEIDHLMTYVRDLGAAASMFRRMGFTLSPISRIEGMGLSNHLVLMTPPTQGFANFIELIAVDDRSRLPPVMASVLSGAEGIKSMVLGSRDISRAQSAIEAAGYAATAPVHIKREWEIGPGESVFPEFDAILPVDAPLVFACCRYFNVELYLRPQWLTHENGARRLRSVFAIAGDPAAVAKPLGNLFGTMQVDSAVACTSPGEVGLVVMAAENLRTTYGIDVGAMPAGEAHYIGYGIEVESCDRLAACLARGGVRHRKIGNEIAVDPGDAFGNLIVFAEPGA